MKEQGPYTRRGRHSAHNGEEGIALILTLGILAVILIIAVGFALSARTELKSSSSYGDMIAAESLAKMAMDRCIMEIAYQSLRQPLSGNPTNYIAEDLTQIDGSWNNDFLMSLGPGAKGDFINLDGTAQRSSNEPYWIVVSNRTGQIIGRFAYVASGSTADLNAIGNISGLGDTYVRGNGYIGVATNSTADGCGTNTYTRGICSDVNLVAFLRQLGYASPVVSARGILSYRYGWPAGGAALPLGVYKPGDSGFDDNGDGVIDSPQEYDPVQPKGCPLLGQVDQAVPDLTSLDSGLLIAPDPANTNLQDYATTSSSDPNLTNGYGIARLNLNAMTSVSNVTDVVNMLSQVPLGNSSISMNRTQVALNLLDFHTPNRYPTVYQVGGTNTYVGIKPTPYLNQVLDLGRIVVSGSNSAGDILVQIRFDAFTGVEVWNPYSSSFPDPCSEILTNSYSLSLPPAAGASPTNIGATTITFTSPVLQGFPFQQSNIFSFVSSQFSTGAVTWPMKVTVTNTFSWSDFYGLNPTNMINVIAGRASTNAILSYDIANLNQTNWIVINREADDPRMNILYDQPNDSPVGSHVYSLGANNANTSRPNGPNAFTGYADSGPREGLASFFVKASDYVTIGEIGYVHRGEPWSTIRLQPNELHPTTEPFGEGNILEYIRVNDLSEVRGRIGINAETNGPFGASQSPLLFALFEGLTNSVGTPITGPNIQQIIAEMGDRRARNGDFTGIGQICGIASLTKDFATGSTLLPTRDADRETIIRNISNLITARPDSGVTEVIAWGQVVKGKSPLLGGKYFAGPIVQIRAKYNIDRAGHLVRITKFQYTRQ